MNDKKHATVTFYRAHKNSTVVKLFATVEAKTDEEAIDKAMTEIKGVLPVDSLWPEGSWGWYWDDKDEAEVVWVED